MRIGEYTVIRTLGKGGMGEVFEVEDAAFGARHALKLFTHERESPELKTRFDREGRLLARLNHPRIVRVTDIGVDVASGHPYFVMDLVQDERGQVRSLAEVEPGSIDEETIGRWYDDLREALAYIHTQGIVHRDLKLQNVLIGPDAHAVLADFGISRVLPDRRETATGLDVTQTIVRVRDGRKLLMGSVGYMAPELEMGVAATPQSDWYALGVIVYRLLTGLWCDARTDLLATLDSYDPVWSVILPRLLHANPEGRECLSYAACRADAREKEACAAEERLAAADEAFARLRRRMRALRAGMCALAVLLTATGVGLWRTLRPQVEFETLFALPTEGMDSERREQLERARLDALLLTQPILADLRTGKITREKAREDLRDFLRKLRRGDHEDVFVSVPDNYGVGDAEDELAQLLEQAIKRL